MQSVLQLCGGVRRRWRPLGRTSILITATCLVCIFLLVIDNLPDTDLDQGASWEGVQAALRPEDNKENMVDKSMYKMRGDKEKDDNSLYKDEAVLKPKKPVSWLEMVEEIRADWVIGGENVLGLAPQKPHGKGQWGADNRDVSRHREAVLVDELLRHRTGGFYMESGAGDGRTLSSTLFLEQNRGWRGVLLEPDAATFKTLNEYSGRVAARLQVCLSPTGRAGRWSYVGDVEGVEVPGEWRLEAYIPWVTPQDSVLNMPHEGYNVTVQCFPLPAILLALRKMHVDFWVLDAGAAEVDILATAMLDTFIYDVIAVNVWAGSVGETLQKLEQVKEAFSRRPYHPVRILPRHWQKLQAAMLIIQRLPPQYPVTPHSLLDDTHSMATGANTTVTNTTTPAEGSVMLNIQQWLHWPKPRTSTPDRKSPEFMTQLDPQRDQPQGEDVTSSDTQASFSSDTPAQTVLKHLSFREDYWRLLRSLLPDGSPGFFLETNAAEGQLVSTTLHLERQLGWTGLLLEPDPDLFQLLLGRGRQCAALNMCLNVGGGHQGERQAFRRGTNLTPGGRLVQAPGVNCSGVVEDVVCAMCVPLAALPAALNRSTIDFISLQLDDLSVDGITHLDLQVLGVRVVSVEYPTGGQVPGRGQEGHMPALLTAFDKQLVKQRYVQAGSVTDDRHLLTTVLLYRRLDPLPNSGT